MEFIERFNSEYWTGSMYFNGGWGPKEIVNNLIDELDLDTSVFLTPESPEEDVSHLFPGSNPLLNNVTSITETTECWSISINTNSWDKFSEFIQKLTRNSRTKTLKITLSPKDKGTRLNVLYSENKEINLSIQKAKEWVPVFDNDNYTDLVEKIRFNSLLGV